MKTHEFGNNKDICRALLLDKVKRLNYAFEINVKDINKHRKQTLADGSDVVVLETLAFPLTMESHSTTILRRKDSMLCKMYFVNVKNENEEHFSHLLENLSNNDKILVVNGVMQKTNVRFCTVRLIVTIRPENNSLVFLFKYTNATESALLNQKCLSKITKPGVYLLFGCVSKIIKFQSKKFICLRILCFDKSCVKTLKYAENNIKSSSAERIKFHYFSNKVDILVKNPCTEFNSLVLCQRIHLNNVTVKTTNESNVFALKVKGISSNLLVYPTETNSVNSIRPLPVVCQPQNFECSDPTDDDDVHLLNSNDSPTIREEKRARHDLNKHNNMVPNTSVDIISKINHSYFQSKDKLSTKNINSKVQIDSNQKCNNNSINKQVCTENYSSPEKSLTGLCSPNFFLTASTSKPPTFPPDESTPSKLKQTHDNSMRPIQCLGPCWLVYTDPNVFSTFDIVSGYCANNCLMFFPISALNKNSNSNEYTCPQCTDSVHVTFFFKMNFLYGKDYSCAVEVCCYNEYAQHVLKKFTKKNITVENYLSNVDDQKLIIDTIKMFIENKTKVNIVIAELPTDKTKLLQSIDTKYIVTSFD